MIADYQSLSRAVSFRQNWVPQMADTDKVMASIKRKAKVSYPVLVPNMKGLEGALAANAEGNSDFRCGIGNFFSEEHQLLHRRKSGTLRTSMRNSIEKRTPCSRLHFLCIGLPIRRRHYTRRRSKSCGEASCYGLLRNLFGRPL